MNKILLLGLLCPLFIVTAQAQYTLDSTRRMSPGVVYKHYSTSSPARQIHVMEIDLTESTVHLQSVKSYGVIDTSKQTVPQMYAAHDHFRHHDVTAAINSDFFTSQGPEFNPRHMMIGDGEILYDTNLNRTVFGITEDRIPFITKVNGSYSVTAGGFTRTINHINRYYGDADQLIMYNRFKGADTDRPAGGTEIMIEPVNGGDWKANAVITCKVLAKSNAGNMAIVPGKAVLYGVGAAKVFLESIKVGDVISLNLQVIAASSGLTNIKQLTGGWTRLVRDGANYATASVEEEGGASDSTREPRTAIGYNQAKTKIYFVVVDGRDAGGSKGMTLAELGALMVSLGCYQALNLDGGGSSTMVGNGALRNNPSDAGGPRPIPSCLLAYLSSITLDDFENGVGHFNRDPTYSPTTTGVSGLSNVTTAKTCHSGYWSLIVKLYDNTASSANWKARILSGSGIISNNRYFDNTGTFSFYMKTSTAAAGAKVRIWLDDTDGIEMSPELAVLNDGQWHKYTWNLANFNGTPVDTGDGVLQSNGIRLNSIVFTQPNTAQDWFIFIDDIMVDLNGTAATGARKAADPDIPNGDVIKEMKENIIVYPNPGNGIFTIDFKQKQVSSFDLTVMDTYGKKISIRKYKGGTQTVNLSHLPKGIYLLYINGGAVNRSVKIVIK
ncbi:phosphodiester glycosidase family protein [Longitalea luteola]|uniref:phosphodiester glycosidase family protein n=1 Tax=Longitalea luteola TaxID=2812563 RepID=UPI001A96506C|nr:phosphodiester glycosidase family protein [Longitalea luteola]